jgi:hypothetical protein
VDGTTTVVLTLSPSASYTIDTPAAATVSIADNDSAAVLSVTQTDLAFSAVAGKSSPPPQAVLIGNTGAGLLTWSATDDAFWLSEAPSSGSLGAGGNGPLTVSVPSTALAAGHYSATITIVAPGASNSPRTIAVSLDVFDVAPYPYSEAFDGVSGPSLWAGTGSVWQWGVPNSGPNCDHTQGATGPGKCYATGLSSDYPDNCSGFLLSPCIEIPLTANAPEMVFWMWMLAESRYDAGHLEISIDGGPFAMVQSNLLSPSYTDFMVQALTDGYQGWSGFGLAIWTKVTMSLSPYIGSYVQFRFHFASDGSAVMAGWFIDDFSVRDSSPAATSEPASDGSCGGGPSGRASSDMLIVAMLVAVLFRVESLLGRRRGAIVRARH